MRVKPTNIFICMSLNPFIKLTDLNLFFLITAQTCCICSLQERVGALLGNRLHQRIEKYIPSWLHTNYKDTGVTLTESVQVFFCRWLWTCFCLLGYFQKGPLRRILRNNSIPIFRNFQVTKKCISFMVKQFVVLFELKIWDFT